MFMSGSLECSLINSLSDRAVHIHDRLYLGGSHNIRGFQWNSIGPRVDSSALGGAASYAAILHIYRPLVPADMLFAHMFIANGSIASIRSKDRFNDMINAQRITAGLGLVFVFRNLIRFEMNYCIPCRYVPGDFCSPGLYFGAGINFL
ncbi:unnamed protein product [Anisakis simplex]|uniref:SAM50-like protein gop-3 (inferred by orthology to a C. elegans protein) n=1 Tax=Anisakis simplex TaxID=6269 RepID=A0A0M3JK29_ANISI|nr:unnamed protein product [Anisakis simplex]